MRVRTERWTKLAARGRFKMEAKARIGGIDYTAISAPKIDRSLMSAPLSVGNCTSATLGLSILTDDAISSTAPIVILGRLTDGNVYSEWKEFGTFFINQRDTSYAGLLTIDCFDSMLKANQSYVSDSDSAAEWPKPMKTVVEEIAYRIGVGVDPRTKINTGTDYVVGFPSGKTMIQVLGSIGACHGGNWIITEENLLRLVPLVTSPDETFHLIDEDYEKIKTVEGDQLIYKQQLNYNAVLPPATGESPSSAIPITHYITDEYGAKIVTSDGHFLVWAEDGSIDAVDGLINIPVVCGTLNKGDTVVVTGVTMADESGNSYTAGNDNGIMLTIEGNPYATQGICNALYAAFNGLVYSPYTATKTLYDPATELGDQVKIGDMVHSVLYASTLTFDLDFRADISAPNSEELSEEYPYLSEIKKLKQSTEDLNGAIQRTATELAESIGATDTDVGALAESLAAEVSRASSVEQALAGRIDGETTRAQSAESALAGRVASLEGASPGQMRERLQALETTVSGLSTKADNNATAIETLDETLSECLDIVSDLDDTATDHTTRIGALEGATSNNASLISILRNRIVISESTLISVLSRLNVIEGNGNPLMDISVSLLPALNVTTVASAENQEALSVSLNGNVLSVIGSYSELNSFSMPDSPTEEHKWACLVIDTGESDITAVSVNGSQLTADDVAAATNAGVAEGSFIMWVKVDDLINIPITLTLATENKTSVSLVFSFSDTDE